MSFLVKAHMCTFDKVNPKANWTPLEVYKYKWPQTRLDTSIIRLSLVWLAHFRGNSQRLPRTSPKLQGLKLACVF